MTGSFLFVKPSDPEGKIGTAYSDPDKPRYPYDRASWEWLLERTIRRTLIPWALTKSHSRELLSGHEDKYSMHRWGSYGVSDVAGSTPTAYENVGGPGSSGRKTDSDLSGDDRSTPLPESWNSSEGAPTNSEGEGTKVAYGIVDLEEAVATLPFSLEWLHPDWSSSDLDAWNLTAETTETTEGSATADINGNASWTWHTTVEHTPYDIPDDVPFKCLSHMRTDDDLVTVGITNDDDDETITVETAPTPVRAPKTTGGSVRYFNGAQIRSAIDGAAHGFDWVNSELHEFSIPYRYGLDYSPSTGPYAYSRDGKTSDSSTIEEGSTPLIGCLVDVPDMAKYIAVSYGGNAARFIHDIGWGDDKKQTYWHAKDFPKGIDSVLSPKLKTQLKALCPVCQPTIPPAVPAFWKKFPDAGPLQWDNPYASVGFLPLYYVNMYPPDWMQHLALACTPLDMSARLDAMTTTVHRVPTLFAKIKTVIMEYSTSRTDSERSDSPPWWEVTTVRKVITEEGISSAPLSPKPSSSSSSSYHRSVSGHGSGVDISNSTETYPSYTVSGNTKTQYTWEESFESKSEYLVCLRSTANTELSTKTTTNTSETRESSYGNPSSSETETSYGYLPNSYDPDPDDLLFPDWVLPWIETAELFAAIKSYLLRNNSPDYTQTNHFDEKGGTTSLSGSGGGSRTHKAQLKIVSLGQMDTSTGRFPALDAATVLSKIDPDPDEPTGWDKWGSYDLTSTETTDAAGYRTDTDVVVAKGNGGSSRYRYASYYVVVKWKFDRTNPKSLATG